MLARFFRTGSGRSSQPPNRTPPALRVEPLEDRTVLNHGLASAPLALPAPPFSEIVAFGDSLTDTGNVFIATGGAIPASPPYFNGHFSNGPVWVEYLADNLGLPLPAPSLGGGTNYAFSTAETGFGFTPDGVPNVGTQIDAFLGGGNTLQEDDLVVVWAGANDFIRGGEIRPWVPVRNLARHITTLADAGATTILTANLPPLGLLPAFRDHPLQAAFLNLETVVFNHLLDFTLNRLDRRLPGVDIIRLDVFGLVVQGAADPGEFGFTNVRDPVLEDGSVVGDPDTYFWWDEVHPTTRVHELLGDAATEAILYPASLGQGTNFAPGTGNKPFGGTGMAGLVGLGFSGPRDLPNHRPGDVGVLDESDGQPSTTRKGPRQSAGSPLSSLDSAHGLRDAVFTLLGNRDLGTLSAARR
jgi:phospholipase/lecithinase/hemolysin